MPLAVDFRRRAQPSSQTAAVDEGNGAAAYTDPVTQEFAAERTSRLRRDRGRAAWSAPRPAKPSTQARELCVERHTAPRKPVG